MFEIRKNIGIISILIVFLMTTLLSGCGKKDEEQSYDQNPNEQFRQRMSPDGVPPESGRMSMPEIQDTDKPDGDANARGRIITVSENGVTLQNMPVMRRGQDGEQPPPREGTEERTRPISGEITYTVNSSAKIKRITFNGQELEVTAISLQDVKQDQTASVWLNDVGEIIYMQIMEMQRPGEGAPPVNR